MCIAYSHSPTPEDKFVGCDGYQGGQRFLDSSDPRLIRHVASCEAAGGGIEPLPAGKDQKLSQEFEDGVLIGRAAPVPSLLDSLTNNRHNEKRISPVRASGFDPKVYERPLGRGKFCGRLSITGVDPKTGRKNVRRLNCGSWACSYCGPRKARTARAAIRTAAEDLGLRYFLTLTLDPSKVPNKKMQIPHLRKVFNKFREYLRRKYDVAPKFICVVEFTQAGVPHLHILFDRYLPQKWISTVWSRLGGGHIVFIKQVTVLNVAKYLSKYLTKELLLSAPKGTRRITTARGIKLFPKFASAIAWEVLKRSIYGALLDQTMKDWTAQTDMFSTVGISLEFDEEKYLKAFQVHLPILAT